MLEDISSPDNTMQYVDVTASIHKSTLDRLEKIFNPKNCLQIKDYINRLRVKIYKLLH